MTLEADVTPTEKPKQERGPNWARNQARRERKARGGSRSARAESAKTWRPQKTSLESKRKERMERESTDLDWLKSDLKAKKHKFKIAYDILEELSPRIDDIIRRIRETEPTFDLEELPPARGAQPGGGTPPTPTTPGDGGPTLGDTAPGLLAEPTSEVRS
jgi:hypothetical protein